MDHSHIDALESSYMSPLNAIHVALRMHSHHPLWCCLHFLDCCCLHLIATTCNVAPFATIVARFDVFVPRWIVHFALTLHQCGIIIFGFPLPPLRYLVHQTYRHILFIMDLLIQNINV